MTSRSVARQVGNFCVSGSRLLVCARVPVRWTASRSALVACADASTMVATIRQVTELVRIRWLQPGRGIGSLATSGLAGSRRARGLGDDLVTPVAALVLHRSI